VSRLYRGTNETVVLDSISGDRVHSSPHSLRLPWHHNAVTEVEPSEDPIAARRQSAPILAGITVLRSAGLALVVGMLCGIAAWLFHRSLTWVTSMRSSHRWLVVLLPIAGVAIVTGYRKLSSERRLNMELILRSATSSDEPVAARIAPMVLLGTLTTHLFGGSAGREGTAVQMGAGLAAGLGHMLVVPPTVARLLLYAGMAAGFAAVFGTPIAGAIFALEVCRYRAGWRTLIAASPSSVAAAFVGDFISHRLGVSHVAYAIGRDGLATELTVDLALRWIAIAAAVALCAHAYLQLTALVRNALQQVKPWQRVAAGGAIIAIASLMFGDQYLGLGLPTISAAFTSPVAQTAFAIKLVLTAITVGAGFIGGEVTPLFFVGATLGNVLAPLLGIPLGLCAGVTMCAMFGVAARVPIAITLMAGEMFGSPALIHVALVTLVGSLLMGKRGLY
jgi:H+/Cl- antiporter ClcA